MLTLCLTGNFSCILSFADFSKSTFSKSSLRKTTRVSNSLDSDFVGPDLGQNQGLSTHV